MIPPAAPQTAQPNGAKELRGVTRETPIDEVARIADEDGAVILKGMLTPAQVAQLNDEIQPLLDSVQCGSLNPDVRVQKFHGYNTKRVCNLTNTSAVFRDHMLDDDFIHAISDKLFKDRDGAGDYWLGTAATIHIGPGEIEQGLHRDMGNYPVYYRFGPEGPECQLNFLFATTNFTEENGATRIIPGSNHWTFDQRGLPSQCIPALMKAGDCLMITGKVVHGGGANNTDVWRGCVSMTVNASFLTPEEAHPFIVSLDVAKTLSRRAQKFLGFRSQWPSKVPGLWTKDYTELSRWLDLDADRPAPTYRERQTVLEAAG